MSDIFTFEDALQRQFAAAASRNKAAFYSASPVVCTSKQMQSINLPVYAGWELFDDYGLKPSVTLKIKVGDRVMGHQLAGLQACSIQGIKDGIPFTDYEDAVAQINYLADLMRRALLTNLADEYKRMMDAVCRVKEKQEA